MGVGLKGNSLSIQPQGQSTLPGFIAAFLKCFSSHAFIFIKVTAHTERRMTQPSAVQITQISCSLYVVNLLTLSVMMDQDCDSSVSL